MMLKKTSQTNVVENLILNQYQWKNSIVVDLTTINRYNPFAKLSPYYPHSDIPILNSPFLRLNSVNEVWQILCVNKGTSGDSKEVLFRKGIGINEYYTYEEARREILLPTYRWMLENKAFDIICKLREYNEKGGTIVFIDKTSNTDIADVSQPLSFAFLLKAYIECTFPYEDAMEEYEECKCMVGRKVLTVTVKKKRPKFITINTDAQRGLTFKYNL